MVSLTSIVRSGTGSRCAIALPIAIALAPTWGHAEVQVRGTPQAVVIEAQDATVEEILVALSTKFKIQFRSAANLDKQLTGTFDGTVQQAVSRVLRGYNFISKSGQAGLEIILFGAGKPVTVEARPTTKSIEVAPAASSQPTETSGSVPTIVATQGAGPVAKSDSVRTPPAPGAALGPMPQLSATENAGLVPSGRSKAVVPLPIPPQPRTPG
jgi:hypothetical protein